MKVATTVLLLVLAMVTSRYSSVDAFYRLGHTDEQTDDTTDDTTTTTDDSTGDDDGGLIPENQTCDANWEQTKADYEANVATWGSPECYAFTIRRGCFCTDAIRRPARVRVENGVVVTPANSQELFLRPMAELFDEVFRLCVKDCPDRGAARCDVSYGAAGNLQAVFIDRSFMIADEEISYDIYNYTTCSLP